MCRNCCHNSTFAVIERTNVVSCIQAQHQWFVVQSFRCRKMFIVNDVPHAITPCERDHRTQITVLIQSCLTEPWTIMRKVEECKLGAWSDQNVMLSVVYPGFIFLSGDVLELLQRLVTIRNKIQTTEHNRPQHCVHCNGGVSPLQFCCYPE